MAPVDWRGSARPEDRIDLRLRLATGEDAAAVLAIYEPVVRGTAISFEWDPPSVGEMRRRIEDTLARLPWLVAVSPTPAGADEVVGYASASPYRSRTAYQWSVETSVYVAEPWRGHGVARRLYAGLQHLVRAQGYRVAYGVVTLPNPASVGLHERLGFERVGLFRAAGYKLGAWHDVLWLRHELATLDADPAAPVPLDDLDPAVVSEILG